MPALAAGIHVFLWGTFSEKGVDGRDKPGHDEHCFFVLSHLAAALPSPHH